MQTHGRRKGCSTVTSTPGSKRKCVAMLRKWRHGGGGCVRLVVDYVYVDVEFDNKVCKERISVQFQLGQLMTMCILMWSLILRCVETVWTLWYYLQEIRCVRYGWQEGKRAAIREKGIYIISH